MRSAGDCCLTCLKHRRWHGDPRGPKKANPAYKVNQLGVSYRSAGSKPAIFAVQLLHEKLKAPDVVVGEAARAAVLSMVEEAMQAA